MAVDSVRAKLARAQAHTLEVDAALSGVDLAGSSMTARVTVTCVLDNGG